MLQRDGGRRIQRGQPQRPDFPDFPDFFGASRSELHHSFRRIIALTDPLIRQLVAGLKAYV